MKDWVKVQVFDRIYQAELCKNILQRNNIESYVINARDSLFLLGDIELFVENQNEARAKMLIEEFDGLTKINSFFLKKPIDYFTGYLASKGIETVVKQKEDTKYLLDNFEVYVKNEDIDRVIPILRGEAFDGWVKIDSCEHTRQARFRFEILDEKNVKAIIIKKKDTNFHLEELEIWVEEKNKEVATTLLSFLNGWIKLGSFETARRAEMRENFLGKKGMRSMVKKNTENSFDLFVECHNEENAIELINEYKEWIQVASFETIVDAEFTRDTMEENGIHAVLMNRKDNSFLVGEIELFVDEDDEEKAKLLIQEIKKIEE